jgi:class 3 adenylate cyclase
MRHRNDCTLSIAVENVRCSTNSIHAVVAGRFVNSAGDSVLVEFAGVVNAVQCVVEIQTTEIQTALKTENASLPPEGGWSSASAATWAT